MHKHLNAEVLQIVILKVRLVSCSPPILVLLTGEGLIAIWFLIRKSLLASIDRVHDHTRALANSLLVINRDRIVNTPADYSQHRLATMKTEVDSDPNILASVREGTMNRLSITDHYVAGRTDEMNCLGYTLRACCLDHRLNVGFAGPM